MTDHVLSQSAAAEDQDKPRRIDDLDGQLVMQVDGDGRTIIRSNEKPTQMVLFKGDTDNAT